MPADCMNYLEGVWARVLMGGPGTGVMPAATRQAAALVEAGGHVDELLLVGPSPAAAQALAEQVAGLLDVESASLRVATLGGLRGEEPYGYDEGLDELAAEAGV